MAAIGVAPRPGTRYGGHWAACAWALTKSSTSSGSRFGPHTLDTNVCGRARRVAVGRIRTALTLHTDAANDTMPASAPTTLDHVSALRAPCHTRKTARAANASP